MGGWGGGPSNQDAEGVEGTHPAPPRWTPNHQQGQPCCGALRRAPRPSHVATHASRGGRRLRAQHAAPRQRGSLASTAAEQSRLVGRAAPCAHPPAPAPPPRAAGRPRSPGECAPPCPAGTSSAASPPRAWGTAGGRAAAEKEGWARLGQGHQGSRALRLGGEWQLGAAAGPEQHQCKLLCQVAE